MIRNAGFSQNTFVSRTAHTQKRKKLGFNGIIVEPELMRKGWQALKENGGRIGNHSGIETKEGSRIFTFNSPDCKFNFPDSDITDLRWDGLKIEFRADKTPQQPDTFEINEGARVIRNLSAFGRKLYEVTSDNFRKGPTLMGEIFAAGFSPEQVVEINTARMTLEDTARTLKEFLRKVTGTEK